jgi:glutaredoxin
MKDLNVIVYTMKGCPFCDQFKEMLVQESIDFFDRDIDENSDEYDSFSKITENDMIPALLIIEGDGDNYESFLYAPDRNYMELTEAVDIINEHRKKVGII